MNIGECLELIGKRWNILMKLYERKRYVNELAGELHKSPPQISKELKELKNNGLVEYEQKEGKRLKYYYLTDSAKKILAAVTVATRSEPEETLEKWQVDEFLSILEDQSLSDELRQSYSEGFHSICAEHPKQVIGNMKARKLLEKVVANPLYDKVTQGLMISVSTILEHVSRLENGRKWVSETLYPVFFRNMKNKNEKIQVWAIRMVGKMASSNINLSVKRDAEKEFLDIWFSDETDPNSKLREAVRLQLMKLVSKRLFENVRARAKSQKDKAKAEALLEALKTCLLPKRSVR